MVNGKTKKAARCSESRIVEDFIQLPKKPTYAEKTTGKEFSIGSKLGVLMHRRALAEAAHGADSVIASRQTGRLLHPMKLAQGQIWKTSPDVHSHEGDSVYLRIVELERLSVTYKEMLKPDTKDGHHKEATKKVFCRLIKHAELLRA